MPFETFNPFKQPPKKDAETHKANVAVVRALLGERDAEEYEELTKEDVVDATTPLVTEADLAKVTAMQDAERNREKRETKAEKTKRLWMVWADKFNLDEDKIEEKAEFQENGEVVWDGDCNWTNKRLTEFPPNFVEVTGTFWCNHNQFTSLEGGPKIVGEDFWCSNNQLTSLEGSPQTVGGNFFCYNNPLLTTFPAGIHIGGLVYISQDQLQLKADAESKGYKVRIV